MSPADGKVREQFQYAPLPNPKHIRILVLQPLQTFGDPIYADIEIADVTQSPVYAALSYSWGMNDDGDASLCRTITVQGAKLAITQNLFEALQQLLMSRHMPLRLWVDAVCINQTDAQEQSCQVGMMAEIYSKAHRTTIWLGEGREDDDLQNFQLFERLRHIEEDPCFAGPYGHGSVMHAFVASGVGRCMPSREALFCPCGGPLFPQNSPRRPFRSLKTPDELLFDMLHTFVSGDRALLDLFTRRSMAIARFINRRYWCRRWVVQEIQHSKALSIHWNKFKISPKMLDNIHVQLDEIVKVSKEVMRRCRVEWPRREKAHTSKNIEYDPSNLQTWPILKLFDKERSSFRNDPEWSFGKLLFQFDEMECSDPRDRLFSMLSLAQVDWIRPDYNQSTIQTYTAFAKGLIERSMADVVFKNVNRSSLADDISANLPSWVPDLRETFRTLRSGQTENLNLRFAVNGTLEATFVYLGTVADFNDRTNYFSLVSTTQVEPWLGIFGRSGPRKSSYKVRFSSICVALNSQPISRLRNGDILCTTHSNVADLWSGRVLKGFRVFLRRTDANEHTYSMICCLDYKDIETNWVRELKRLPPSTMTVQLV